MCLLERALFKMPPRESSTDPVIRTVVSFLIINNNTILQIRMELQMFDAPVFSVEMEHLPGDDLLI